MVARAQADLVETVLTMHHQRMLRAEILQRAHHDADQVRMEDAEQDVGSAGRIVSGPRMLKRVRTPSSLRTGATFFIAGW